MYENHRPINIYLHKILFNYGDLHSHHLYSRFVMLRTLFIKFLFIIYEVFGKTII